MVKSGVVGQSYSFRKFGSQVAVQHTTNEMINQRGEVVMSLKAMTLIRCRNAGPAT